MLNPDKNLYSVAPVGGNIIIGRHIALRGGLSREQALNLLTWLIISTNSSPTEIASLLKDANTANSVARAGGVPRPPQMGHVDVDNVKQFIGTIDPEEQAAIDAAIEEAGKTLPGDVATIPQIGPSPTLKCGPQVVSTPQFSPAKPGLTTSTTKTVDETELLKAWGGTNG